MSEDQKTLDQGSSDVAGGGDEGQVRNHREPSSEITQIFSAVSGSEDGDPIEWSTCQRNPEWLSQRRLQQAKSECSKARKKSTGTTSLLYRHLEPADL
ncbi:MAG: hypothetical protein Q9157_006927, partial [Trypethelium eluteriae]